MSAVTARAEDASDTYDFAEMDLEQLMELKIDSVYGASKHEQRVTQAPSAISIITASEIKRFGHRTLVDVLRSVRGLYVSDDRNYTYLGIRGFHRPNDYNTRVLVLIDGHRMNDNIFDSGTIGREGAIDVELIERVEVIRGPSSSIYGSSAFLGVINVVTKRAQGLDGLELSADAGSYDSYKSRLSYGSKFESGLEWLVSASHHTSEGPRSLYFSEYDQRISDDVRAANDGIALGLDGEQATAFFTNLRYGHWAFSAFATDRVKDVPTASFGTVFNDPREWTDDERQYADVKYDRAFNDTLRLQARAFYDYVRYRGEYPYDYDETGNPEDIVISKDGTGGEWIGTEWQLTAHLAGGHRLIVGGEYRDNIREYQYMFDDTDPPYYYIDFESSSRTLGLFVQGEAALREDLTLNAGVRYDRYSTNSVDVLNPRVALIYNPTPLTAIKMLYGEAFRAPNPYEAYYSEGQKFRPPLDPETIDTYELVFERYFGRHYRVNVSGYYYEVDGLISQAATEDDLAYFDNVDSVHAQGVELELEGKFDSGALLRASYALQRSEDGVTHRELSSSPRHVGKLNVSIPLFKPGLSSGIELQYHGRVKALDGSDVDDFLVTNLTLLSQKLTKGLEISASVFNALDEKYAYPGAEDHLQSAIEQNGRTVHAMITYRF